MVYQAYRVPTLSWITQSHSDTSLFTYYTATTSLVLLIYVDDILISCSSLPRIEEIKTKLHKQFSIKDLGKPYYYLGVEFIRGSKGIMMTQRKYALDLIEYAGLMNAKHAKTPLNPQVKLQYEDGTPLADPSQ